MNKLYTPQEVLRKIEKFCDDYPTYQDAAEAIGCTPSQLTHARAGNRPPAASILTAIGVERVPLYVSDLDPKLREAT